MRRGQTASYGARGATPDGVRSARIGPGHAENIMEEKYVALFLNIEAWNDYKRTCLPSLAPAPPLGSTTRGRADSRPDSVRDHGDQCQTQHAGRFTHRLESKRS